MLWNIEELIKLSRTFDAPGFSEPGTRALFFEGLPWKGRNTRVFAWLGLPEQHVPRPLPAMVLVHGGGGTAFAEWVRLWNDRGYAAIAMDLCGCTAGGDRDNRLRHEQGGPLGYGGWEQMEWPVEDQWPYHAVADVILAHSLLRSFNEVDSSRIGLTGISWGGFITCIVAGLDSRFQFAAPVYGCGCVSDNEFLSTLLPEDKTQAARWLELWDPAHFLPQANLPMLWVNGTNDFAFPMNVHQQSYRLAPGQGTLSIGLNMAHTQSAGAEAPEILAFADQHCHRTPALVKVVGTGIEKFDSDMPRVWAGFEGTVPVVRAELLFTNDAGAWTGRTWRSKIAPLEKQGEKGGRAQTFLPADATAWFFNFYDERGLLISSEMECKENMPAWRL